jgi:hypothetical protein
MEQDEVSAGCTWHYTLALLQDQVTSSLRSLVGILKTYS